MATSDRQPGSGTTVQGAPKPARPTRRGPRSTLERGFLRLVATVGIIGIAVGVGAILADHKVQGWIIGLVVAVVTIVLGALLSGSHLLSRED